MKCRTIFWTLAVLAVFAVFPTTARAENVYLLLDRQGDVNLCAQSKSGKETCRHVQLLDMIREGERLIVGSNGKARIGISSNGESHTWQVDGPSNYLVTERMLKPISPPNQGKAIKLGNQDRQPSALVDSVVTELIEGRPGGLLFKEPKKQVKCELATKTRILEQAKQCRVDKQSGNCVATIESLIRCGMMDEALNTSSAILSDNPSPTMNVFHGMVLRKVGGAMIERGMMQIHDSSKPAAHP